MLVLVRYNFFSHDLYCLLDSGSTLYCVTPYISMSLGFDPTIILNLFFISTRIVDLIIAEWVYKGRVVSVGDRKTLVDLLKLGMMDFNVILGMDWLYF